MQGVPEFPRSIARQNSGTPLDKPIGELAGHQHGVTSSVQLLELGLTKDTIHMRVKAGRLHRVLRGVYAVGHPKLTTKGWWMAAVLACGDGARLSHGSAAALHGLRPSSGRWIDVTCPRGGLRRVGNVRRHVSTALQPQDVSVVDGIPCTSAARTLLDIAARSDFQALRRACSRAETLRIYDHREVLDVLARANGHKGAALLAEAVHHGRIAEDVTRSDLEEAMLAICTEHAIERPTVNVWLPELSCEVDFLWHDLMLVVEADGAATHGTVSGTTRDYRKDQRLERAGYRVIRFTWADALYEPRRVADTLRDLIAQQRAAILEP